MISNLQAPTTNEHPRNRGPTARAETGQQADNRPPGRLDHQNLHSTGPRPAQHPTRSPGTTPTANNPLLRPQSHGNQPQRGQLLWERRENLEPLPRRFPRGQREVKAEMTAHTPHLDPLNVSITQPLRVPHIPRFPRPRPRGQLGSPRSFAGSWDGREDRQARRKTPKNGPSKSYQNFWPIPVTTDGQNAVRKLQLLGS